MTREPVFVSSRDNPLLATLRKLNHDPAGYRKLGQVWLEGEHLCTACAARGPVPTQAVVSERGWADAGLRALAAHAPRVVVLSEALFAGLSQLASQARIGFLVEPPRQAGLQPDMASVVLDRLQDAGNVGSVRPRA